MTNPTTRRDDPVEIRPRTPDTAATVLHHRHDIAAACAACEINELRTEILRLHEARAAAANALESGRPPIELWAREHTCWYPVPPQGVWAGYDIDEGRALRWLLRYVMDLEAKVRE